ncbi:MAG TPA: hypothetical protein VKA13_00920 [Gammaproteobacteria bacterium]|nr:hypothetical protein [Gammaproteobacteria bacterium]
MLTHVLLLTTLLNSVAWAWYSSPQMLTGHSVVQHRSLGDSESWDGGTYGKDHFCSQGICHLIGHLIGFILAQAIVPGAPFEGPASLYQLRLVAADLAPPLKPPRA